MDVTNALQLIVTAIVSVWGIYQTFVTKRLEYELHLIQLGLDQSIELLKRARESTTSMHKAYIFMLSSKQVNRPDDETYFTKFAEYSACWAELRGLASAIQDQKLLELVEGEYEFEKLPSDQRHMRREEAEIRRRSHQIHTRISELQALATKKQ